MFDAEPVFDDGMPAYGSDFVTEGLIFEEGTLDDSLGFDAEGNVLEAVADKVIGEWKCFGYMIGDGAETAAGEWVVSTQTYRFYGEDGRTTDDDMVVSTGTEHVPGEPVVRAITGGTGRYETARGEVHQLTTGFGENMGVLAEFNHRAGQAVTIRPEGPAPPARPSGHSRLPAESVTRAWPWITCDRRGPAIDEAAAEAPGGAGVPNRVSSSRSPAA